MLEKDKLVTGKRITEQGFLKDKELLVKLNETSVKRLEETNKAKELYLKEKENDYSLSCFKASVLIRQAMRELEHKPKPLPLPDEDPDFGFLNVIDAHGKKAHEILEQVITVLEEGITDPNTMKG